MVKVSVIVPVYNVEKYLLKCLNSLKNQTFQNFEVLVFNDGSTDESGVIAKRYCETINNFYYYSHENRGLGPTRNRGIELSNGEYLMFVDSDDSIPNNAIELLYSTAIADNADVVCGETLLTYDDEDSKALTSFKYKYVLDNFSRNYEFFLRNFYFNRLYTHMACDKIYRKSLIVDNGIYFGDNNLMFSEDNFFQINLFQNLSKIVFLDEVVYYYYQRKNSIMQTYKPNLISRSTYMLKELERNIDLTYLNNQLLSLLTYDIIIMETLNLLSLNISRKNFTSQMNLILSDEIYNKNIKQISKMKSFNLIKNTAKKSFIYLFSLLIRFKFERIASTLLYTTYIKRFEK